MAATTLRYFGGRIEETTFTKQRMIELINDANDCRGIIASGIWDVMPSMVERLKMLYEQAKTYTWFTTYGAEYIWDAFVNLREAIDAYETREEGITMPLRESWMSDNDYEYIVKNTLVQNSMCYTLCGRATMNLYSFVMLNDPN